MSAEQRCCEQAEEEGRCVRSGENTVNCCYEIHLLVVHFYGAQLADRLPNQKHI